MIASIVRQINPQLMLMVEEGEQGSGTKIIIENMKPIRIVLHSVLGVF